jgi:hypothetical protein
MPRVCPTYTVKWGGAFTEAKMKKLRFKGHYYVTGSNHPQLVRGTESINLVDKIIVQESRLNFHTMSL